MMTSTIMETKEEVWNIYKLIDHVKFDNSLPHVDYNRTVPVSRKAWNECGDMISKKEKDSSMIAPADKIITLRLDIKNMSTIRKTLLKLGVFESPWSVFFAEYMKFITKSLAEYYRTDYAYTQSDEITLMIVPTSNPGYGHPFGGRHDKLIAESASRASVMFNLFIHDRYATNCEVLVDLPIVTFDSRMAIWDKIEDAFQVILWRAYDCGVNGISDYIYQLNIGNLQTIGHNKLTCIDDGKLSRNKLNNLNTNEKLLFLQEHGLLPLPNHRAYGTLIYKYIVNDKTVYEMYDQNIVNAVKNKSLPGLMTHLF